MHELSVDNLFGSSGSAPASGYDPISFAVFTEWESGDAAHFSVMVPTSYNAGADFFLRIDESTQSMSKHHKWQVDTVLLRPGIHATDESDESETFSSEYEAPEASHQLATRTMQVTGTTEPGRVSDIPVAAGDVLSFTLSRTGASTDEDPGPIRVLGLTVVAATTAAATTDCSGRMASIISAVRDLFNEAQGGLITDEFIVRATNRCLIDLAGENYWRRESWVPSMSGKATTNLLDYLPDFQDVHQVTYSGDTGPMQSLGSFHRYLELRGNDEDCGRPAFFVIQNTVLHVYPSPSMSSASGYSVYHSYVPQELTCSPENPNPSIPRSHDSVFVYYALKESFLRDRHAPGADRKFREYSQLYEAAKQKLLGEGEPPRLGLQPYRRS